jgi:glycosyltransferase involved in cell wall biosynthesis
VVIPARDEEPTIARVVSGARAAGFAVVVVDDDSGDRTAAQARRAGATVLSAPFNLGAWLATQTGIRYARERGFGFVVTLDADGQHEPAHIARLLERYQTGPPCNLVIASFPERGSRLRRLAWRLFRGIGLFRVVDLTSGFRLYDREAVAILADEAATFLEYQDVGVLLLLRENGLAVAELAVPMRPRQLGGSRIFHSWAKVFSYMMYSTVLCFSKTSLRGRDGAGPRAGERGA